MSSAEAAQQPTNKYRPVLDRQYRPAGRERDLRILSDGADDQSPAGPEQQEPDDRTQQVGHVRQDVVTEQDLPQIGHVRQDRYRSRIEAANIFADVGRPDQRRQSEAEEHQRQAAGDLIGSTGDRQIGMDQAYQSAQQRADSNRQERVVGLDADDEA